MSALLDRLGGWRDEQIEFLARLPAVAIAPTLDGLAPGAAAPIARRSSSRRRPSLERTKTIALFLDRWAAEFEIGRGEVGRRCRVTTSSRASGR